MHWRAESRAAFQRRPVAEVLADVERAMAALRAAPQIVLRPAGYPTWDGHSEPPPGYDGEGTPSALAIAVVDMRGPLIPELPEAATRLGVGYVAGPLWDRDGRTKYTCSGTSKQVLAWMSWAPTQDLVGIYGDPERGFAGGYAP